MLKGYLSNILGYLKIPHFFAVFSLQNVPKYFQYTLRFILED